MQIALTLSIIQCLLIGPVTNNIDKTKTITLDGFTQDKDSTENKKSDVTGKVTYDIKGFGIAQIPEIINESEEFGVVKLKFCLDDEGSLLPNTISYLSDSTQSPYLHALSIQTLNECIFFPLGAAEEVNCGTITFEYLRRKSEKE